MKFVAHLFRDERFGFVAPFLIVAVGIVLHLAGWVDFAPIQPFLESNSHFWWAPIVLVIFMIVMYAVAWPASLLILPAGVLYKPLPATALIMTGGVLGGLAAYYFSHSLSANSIERRHDTPFVKYLKKNTGLAELCALRLLPGLPHSMINYSAGLLRINLTRFILSTLIGLGIKGFIYTSAIHRTIHIDPGEGAFSLKTLWPLIVLAVLLVVGSWGKKRFTAITDDHSRDNCPS